jgi:cytidine deaminase
MMPVPDAASEEGLMRAARAARERAYAPYSGFRVGAALLDDTGGVHMGCNVENAAYPQSQCAEASAIGVMVAAGARRIVAVAVAGEGASPVTPCGGCRQRLREFAADSTPVLVTDPSGLRLRTTLGELLPHAFGPAHLEPGR